MIDYYTLTVVVRLGCCLYLACIMLRGSSLFLRGLSGFFFALAGSMALFFARSHLPMDWSDGLATAGFTVQAVALAGIAALCWRRDFD